MRLCKRWACQEQNSKCSPGGCSTLPQSYQESENPVPFANSASGLKQHLGITVIIPAASFLKDLVHYITQ